MKHFELKFGEVKEMLTKGQMTQINGGTLCFTTINGNCGGGFDTMECDGDVQYCQGYADGECAGDDCCDGMEC
ncbi:hypothetical protein [Mucilaginibacter lappiensis]|uniref:Uncharacterized protein n=1 Tax=Mucilaginibacter lappiensis TaxID=354630 RepID=A0A841JKK7_9SPHI|nr:hypothetical protein [Mucilaginibacter lappiensis]MBB6131487.1 hypothetical protein [Mucilaginibacter lappiensis]